MTGSEPLTTNDAADRLNPRQTRLVVELLQGFNLTTAAKRAGISFATAKRYMHVSAVREALKAGQRQSLGELARMLAAFDALAVTTLADLTRDKTTPPATRRAAANQLLQRRLQAALLADAELDEQLAADAYAPYPDKPLDYAAAHAILVDMMIGGGHRDAEETTTTTNGHRSST